MKSNDIIQQTNELQLMKPAFHLSHDWSNSNPSNAKIGMVIKKTNEIHFMELIEDW